MPSSHTHNGSDTLPNRERDRPHAVQIELYQRATPTERLAVVARLNATVIGLKEADIRSRFPHLSGVEQRAMLRRWWLTARD
jgi:hypothetical protein